jgi:hypothetical protein
MDLTLQSKKVAAFVVSSLASLSPGRSHLGSEKRGASPREEQKRAGRGAAGKQQSSKGRSPRSPRHRLPGSGNRLLSAMEMMRSGARPRTNVTADKCHSGQLS